VAGFLASAIDIVPALQAEVERLRAELDEARDIAIKHAGDASDSAASLERWRERAEQAEAEREHAYSALSDQGRAVVDSTGSLEDGLNFDALAKSAEVSGLVDALVDVRGDRDSLAEQVKRTRDVDLIRRAISDPGAFVERQRFIDDVYESVPAWSARAVLHALDGEARS
jgi:chromosome segregation ATPase